MMLSFIRRLFEGKPRPRRRIPARYDAAQTTAENRRHWAAADHLSADAANSPEVRRILRARARYEVANNSYAKGIVVTIAAYAIGTGPRLQVQTDDNAINDAIENRFDEWAEEIQLAAKLRTMRMACVQDGEAFAILKTNPRLESPVKLDIQLVEADQVTTPIPYLAVSEREVDGIILDEFGNPTAYTILKRHPGDATGSSIGLEAVTVPAQFVIHYYHADRPGQHRGVPELTPALPLFAQLRRYTLAVIAAAETAADFAAVIYSDAPAYQPQDVQPFDLVDLEPRLATVLPAGYRLGQLETHHPSTTYGEFVRQIICEIARCLNIPLAVALGDSSQYNYASGRLDYQNWYRVLKVERSLIEAVILTPILRAWLDEAILVTDLLPLRVRTIPFQRLRRQWFWDGLEHVDPVKEAMAQKIRLENNLTTLAYEYAKDGRDYETELRQREKELARLVRMYQNAGLTPNGTSPASVGDLPDFEDSEE